MKQQIPWLRVVVEGLVIVGSILMAFGIEAGWEERGERGRRAELFSDLVTELDRNAEDLQSALTRQAVRAEQREAVLAELGPNAAGLSEDSLRVLQTALASYPTYDPSLGVLELLIQSGDLVLFEDRDLRARLAGLSAVSGDYLGNQELVLQLYTSPEFVLETGSVFLEYSDIVREDSRITAASPEARMAAVQFLAFDRDITPNMLRQGTALLEELKDIRQMLQEY